ncbi:MAG: hypothetical protein ACJAYG_000970 [Oceanicoccus sp.]|jgi:hypothetical protein
MKTNGSLVNQLSSIHYSYRYMSELPISENRYKVNYIAWLP